MPGKTIEEHSVMSNVKFKECPKSIMLLISFPMLIGCMLHVDFKNKPCRPYKFNGEEPLWTEVQDQSKPN